MNKFKDELVKIRSWLILIAFAGLVILLVENFWPIVDTVKRLLGYVNVFFYGIIMAFLINIPMSFIEGLFDKYLKDTSFIKRHHRGIAIFLAVIIVALFVTIIFMIIVPETFDSIIRIISNLGNLFSSLVTNIEALLAYLNIDLASLNDLDLEAFLNNFGISYASLFSMVTDLLVGTGTGTITQLISIGGTLFNIIIGFFVCLYLLGSKETFIRQGKKLLFAILPKDIAKRALYYLSQTDDIFKQFVGGKFIEMIIVGVLMYITLKIFDVPYVMLIASMCAIAVFIPYFGALAITIIAIILLLSVDPIKALVFFIIYQVVQNVDGNLIYPKIMGNATGLHAVWILVSVFFFGGIFGPFGMLIAVPLTACLYMFISDVTGANLKKKDLTITEKTTYDDI